MASWLASSYALGFRHRLCDAMPSALADARDPVVTAKRDADKRSGHRPAESKRADRRARAPEPPRRAGGLSSRGPGAHGGTRRCWVDGGLDRGRVIQL